MKSENYYIKLFFLLIIIQSFTLSILAADSEEIREVRTRFAPSPTGYLHIGGARTALFNQIYAKKHGGKFILRVDDTDTERSTAESTKAIFSGLTFLGIEWDEGPFYQHNNIGRHIGIAKNLLSSGNAYLCYCSPEELKEKREKALLEKRVPRYDGKCRHIDNPREDSRINPVIRLKTPENGKTIIEDLILGRVEINNEELDDMILVRSDGSPTYMLSTVVDDYDLKITHVIRGKEHFTNTARQIQILNALEWPTPVYAHLPLILDADGSKMSKRKGAVNVEDYRLKGYLPEALKSYLLYLGWNKAKEKIISVKDSISMFELKDISKSDIRFDINKLNNINFHYIQAEKDEYLAQETLHMLEIVHGLPFNKLNMEKILLGMPSFKKRANTILDIVDKSNFIWCSRPINLDEKSISLIRQNEEKDILKISFNILEELENWTDENIGTLLKKLANDKQLKLVRVMQPLRAALTGKLVSIGVPEIISILGKEETLDRIKDAISQ